MTTDAMMVTALLDWFGEHARSMPWRDDPTPYHVWISEVMLQQTRVETVMAYYHKWMASLPTIEALAKAELHTVLNLWEGLGYYSRARNMHKAAGIVVEAHAGVLPRDVKTLMTLPGIGRYTAGAIASLGYGEDEPVVDGNVKRVVARIEDLEIRVDSGEGMRFLWDHVSSQLPPGSAADYNQAMMELGAVVCTPRNPSCEVCPVSTWCEAMVAGTQLERPVQKAKKKVPHYLVTGAVIQERGKVLIAKRPENGLLGGMWEFPGGKVEPGESLEACLKREIKEELDAGISVHDQIGVYNHAYTHFKVTLHAFWCRIQEGDPTALEASEIRWVDVNELGEYPMGKIDRMISNTLGGM